MTVIKRLKSPVPKPILILQKIAAAFFGSATIVSEVATLFPSWHVPSYVPITFAVAGIINHTFLQLFTEDDN